IWTDVAGVLSADPRLVPTAFTLPNLSYREASEMAYFGASVLHPRTMRPMRDLAIPLQIASSMSPDAPRTLVESTSPETEGHVKAVTSVSGVALIMIEGTGMIGIPGVAGRLFSALADKSINVLVISQASSEQSICTGIRTDDVERALVVLRRTFEIELMRRDINRIYAIENVTVVSVVGDYMREQPGLAGRMFSTLGRANINVLAIAQGAAETNISAVIGAEDTKRAVRALHEAFARGYERLHLFLIGPGGVGKKLLELLEAQSENLREKHHINLRLVGLANSRSMYWDPSGVEYGRATELLAEKGNAYQPDELVELLGDSHVERLLVIDASASEEISDLYVEFLNKRIGIVTPNKKANTGSLDYYHELRDASRRNDVPFLYETTAGGALPVIRTINDLVRTGDTVNRIEGVLSGSLAFIFSKMREGSSFSAAVTEARQLGKTEPDPREDLSGKDVARKLLTLVREAGVPIEQDAITVHSLVPLDLADVSIDEFMDALPGLDDGWAEKMARGPLQIVASWDREEGRGNPGRAEVRAIQISEDSPFATLTGSENMIVITSDRYQEWPMVIRGAGGGPALTASGILSDILIAAERMR
ncbi:MAG: ACT domain-containing protein, partial [Bacteroidetes bacterium]